jgi:uncharacterized membrane protein
MESTPLINTPLGILATLSSIAAFFFWFEKKTKWKFFEYVPGILFIFLIPMIFSNLGIIPSKSPVYDFTTSVMLPTLIALMLLNVNVGASMKVMGRGFFVLLFSILGIIIGAPIGYGLVMWKLNPEAWKAFGAIAGGWIGGNANMAGVAEGLGTLPEDFGIAIFVDNMVGYVLWIPILLASRKFAAKFAKFTGVSDAYVAQMKEKSASLSQDKGRIQMMHIMIVLAIGFAITWAAVMLSKLMPVIQPVMTTKTWMILFVTTIGILASFTPARKVPGSQPLSMALLFIFIAVMGAKAHLSGGMAMKTFWFSLGAIIWIGIHGGFCLLGAKIFKVSVHTAAISSAAVVGGAASAPIVAAYHDEKLVPISILMAIVGYAVGNYGAFAAAQICYWASTLM